ncbi:MAG: hypothetical protein ABWK01_08460 [Infirmifilum sp.]
MRYQDLIDWARENTGAETWIILTKGCCKLPPWELIKTALLYSLNNYFEGRMITRTLVHEFLIYLVGNRNITKARKFFEESSAEEIGYVAISLERDKELELLLQQFKARYSLEEIPYDTECWLSEYSAYLGLPRDKERLISVLRGRAALLHLSR